MRTRRPLLLTAVVALAASLAGCQGSQAPEAEQTAAAANGPDAKPGIVAADARVVLPAVPGRPGVAYFSLRNDSDAPVTLVSIYVDGVGKTEMHETSGGAMSPITKVAIAPGATMAFAPGGRHAMVFDIGPALKPGGEAEMTLTFSDGDKLSMPAKVEAMGAGMQH